MPRRILEGTVTSAKQDKTITVLVERRFMHPIYKKYLKKSSKFAAHDENNTAQEGEKVQIIECAPISKKKRFTLFKGHEATMAEAAGDTAEAKPAKKAAPKAKKEAKTGTK